MHNLLDINSQIGFICKKCTCALFSHLLLVSMGYFIFGQTMVHTARRSINTVLVKATMVTHWLSGICMTKKKV